MSKIVIFPDCFFWWLQCIFPRDLFATTNESGCCLEVVDRPLFSARRNYTADVKPLQTTSIITIAPWSLFRWSCSVAAGNRFITRLSSPHRSPRYLGAGKRFTGSVVFVRFATIFPPWKNCLINDYFIYNRVFTYLSLRYSSVKSRLPPKITLLLDYFIRWPRCLDPKDFIIAVNRFRLPFNNRLPDRSKSGKIAYIISIPDCRLQTVREVIYPGRTALSSLINLLPMLCFALTITSFWWKKYLVASENRFIFWLPPLHQLPSRLHPEDCPFPVKNSSIPACRLYANYQAIRGLKQPPSPIVVFIYIATPSSLWKDFIAVENRLVSWLPSSVSIVTFALNIVPLSP